MDIRGVMKVYRNTDGAWFNLALYTRFYVLHNSNGYFEIDAFIDHSNDKKTVVCLESGYSYLNTAQHKLDEIMEEFNKGLI